MDPFTALDVANKQRMEAERQLAERDAQAEAAQATLEDEQAAHQDTLRLLAERDAQLAVAVGALREAAVWLRNGDYDTRGGLSEMDRIAGVCENGIATLPARAKALMECINTLRQIAEMELPHDRSVDNQMKLLASNSIARLDATL